MSAMAMENPFAEDLEGELAEMMSSAPIEQYVGLAEIVP